MTVAVRFCCQLLVYWTLMDIAMSYSSRVSGGVVLCAQNMSRSYLWPNEDLSIIYGADHHRYNPRDVGYPYHWIDCATRAFSSATRWIRICLLSGKEMVEHRFLFSSALGVCHCVEFHGHQLFLMAGSRSKVVGGCMR